MNEAFYYVTTVNAEAPFQLCKTLLAQTPFYTIDDGFEIIVGENGIEKSDLRYLDERTFLISGKGVLLGGILELPGSRNISCLRLSQLSCFSAYRYDITAFFQTLFRIFNPVEDPLWTCGNLTRLDPNIIKTEIERMVMFTQDIIKTNLNKNIQL